VHLTSCCWKIFLTFLLTYPVDVLMCYWPCELHTTLGDKHNLQLQMKGTHGLSNMWVIKKCNTVQRLVNHTVCKRGFLSFSHRCLLQSITRNKQEEEGGERRRGENKGGLSIISFYCSLVSWPLNQGQKGNLQLFVTVTILMYIVPFENSKIYHIQFRIFL